MVLATRGPSECWRPRVPTGEVGLLCRGQLRGLICWCRENVWEARAARTFHARSRYRGNGRGGASVALGVDRVVMTGEPEPNVLMGGAVLGKPGQSWSPLGYSRVHMCS